MFERTESDHFCLESFGAEKVDKVNGRVELMNALSWQQGSHGKDSAQNGASHRGDYGKLTSLRVVQNYVSAPAIEVGEKASEKSDVVNYRRLKTERYVCHPASRRVGCGRRCIHRVLHRCPQVVQYR
ncbi:hypothetical protein K443DRAFT_394949 [Laccaria amethystina LaAM-08-1]|uniref:Uncharacterized protein n=1 Tax=Laccaria amethystina LaAM-08-1 TaxID=1095629 RepID=A0A0C9WYQ1_9AGAR|nr:hypothetical protein K443DRAFT_394949 [Laccaria amethystina LaAM-08-1]